MQTKMVKRNGEWISARQAHRADLHAVFDRRIAFKEPPPGSGARTLLKSYWTRSFYMTTHSDEWPLATKVLAVGAIIGIGFLSFVRISYDIGAEWASYWHFISRLLG